MKRSHLSTNRKTSRTGRGAVTDSNIRFYPCAGIDVKGSRITLSALASCLLFAVGATGVSAKIAPLDQPFAPKKQDATPAPVTKQDDATAPKKSDDAAKPDGKKEPKKEVAPAAAAGPAPGSITYSGLLDWYYLVNGRAPKSGAGGPIVTPSGEKIAADNFGRYFELNDRELSFALGELNITRLANKSFPLGITATLTVGDTARVVHSTEPGGTSSYSAIQNLFLTYTATVHKRDIAIDFGTFVSPFGLEVIESSSNDNYSRAFNFYYGVPFYHAGVRATTALTPTVTLQAGVVNGWNDIAEDNGAKSVFGQLTWKPGAKFTQILGFISGAEGTGAYGSAVKSNGGGSISTNLLDVQSIYQITPKTKVAGWVSYGNGAGSANGAHLSGNWLGVVGYLRQQLTPRIGLCFRGEQFEDFKGAGTLPGAAVSGLRFGLGYVKLQSYTFTAEYAAFRGHLLSRLEYRHDTANQAVFGAGGSSAKDQDTISFSQVYKF